MRTLTRSLTYLVVSSAMLYSCEKSDLNAPVAAAGTTGITPHKYGLLPVSPEELRNVPIFTPDVLNGGKTNLGLSYSGTLPSTYLMTTPAIRDQGQIGSCTGFCGTETNEILKYYALGGAIASQPAAGSNLAAMMSDIYSTNKFTSPTSYFSTDGALSPLFLYYVERVLVEHYSISSDPGANMVNIGEALQGLSNNSGSGSSLADKGQCTEDYYVYPSQINSQGYNVATSSSSQYKTAPSSAAITNAAGFVLGVQNGSTTTTGATAGGYYTISGTGDNTEVLNCKYAILNNKPVMMGFNVYDNNSYTIFEDLSTSSYIYNPLVAQTSGGKTTYVLNKRLHLLGGHAVPLVGYVDDGTATTSATGGGYFIVQNSWGTPWGYHGYFALPYSVLRNNSVVGSGNLYVMVQ
ncbi:MAG TPA: C1 family peptidase [Puia sp.]|nr:C1 family peptidase [Puia sp.]